MEIQNSDVTNIITETINTMFNQLFASIDNNLYTVLDDIIFINTDIINSNFEKILGTSSANGLLLIANSLIIGFILYYCFRLLFSYLFGLQIQRPYQFIFKLILFTILMNYSYFICENIIFINSSVCTSIRALGEYIFNKNICFSELINDLNSIVTINSNSLNIFSIDGMIKTILSISLFNLVFSYSFRYILIQLLILLSPFALLSLCTTSTSIFFKSWIKSFISLLFVQQFVSLILLIIFSIQIDNKILTKIIYIGSIYVLLKANSFSREFIGGISSDVNIGLKSLSNFTKK